jgi:hypothetical protein
MAPLSPDAEEKLRVQLEEIFRKFDADGSGEVDTDEISAMLQSLGMLVQPTIVSQMMAEADTDKSGQIDFQEFFAVMKKQAEEGSSGMFAALVNRQKNAGPASNWDMQKAGDGCKAGAEDPRVVTKGVGGGVWGGAKLDRVFRSGTTPDTYDAADFLVEIVHIPKVDGEDLPMYIGLCNNNFDPSEDAEPKDSANTIVVSSQTGKVYSKKRDLAPATVMGRIESGDTVQIEVRMRESSARFTIIDKSGGIKSGASLDVPLPVATLMVAFQAHPQGEEWVVTLKGQSCEKSLVNEMDSDEIVSNEKKAAGDATNAAAMSMA